MKPPAEMGTDEVREFLLRLKAEGYAPSTLAICRAGLRLRYSVTLRRR